MTLTGTFAEKPLVDRGLAVRLRRHEIKPNVIRVGTQTSRGYERAARRGPQGDEVTHLGRNRPLSCPLETAATRAQDKTDIEARSKPRPLVPGTRCLRQGGERKGAPLSTTPHRASGSYYSRRQLSAKAAIAASRVASYPCVGVRSS